MYSSQLYLIAKILETAYFDYNENTGHNINDTLATRSLLIKDTNGEPRELYWNYHSVIGMLNYYVGLKHPDIAMAVHQIV